MTGDRPRADGRTRWRIQAWITAALVLAILFVGNRLAREHVSFERDLSEDQLFAPSAVGLRMVAELEDVLQVRAFFTGEAKLGPVQIAKRRLIDQLEEYEEAARGRMELTFADPNDSSAARAEAQALGIAPAATGGVRGTSSVSQDVWLGIVLRYRGREIVRPWVLPQTFEYAFLGGLRKLLRHEEVTVGFLVQDGRGGDDPFTSVRALLASQYRLREVLDLETGEAVPDEVSVLVVGRPTDLHPRAAFAVDQFVQRGGRVLFLVDRVLVDLARGASTPVETGLEELFEAWGAPVSEELLWEPTSCNNISLTRSVQLGDRQQPGQRVSLPYPLWPNLSGDALDEETPVTAQLRKADLFWAHPVEMRAVDGLEARALVRSTDGSATLPRSDAAILDPSVLVQRAVEVLAGVEPASRPVVVALSGRFPSPFRAGAPAPFDAVARALHEDAVERALLEGREPPPPSTDTTEETVLDAATQSQVVVVGDADWATSDGKFLTADNQLLFANLVDWLALEDDLLALRARVPRERRIDDIVAEARAELGLSGPVEIEGVEGQAIARIEERAQELAAARRRMIMLGATGGSLALALALGLLWRLVLFRPPTVRVRLPERGR
jgi:ABC-type uncharacterized transport system involved in gliding motility auxiliary subunit